jgi:hypothetical protein
MTVPFATTGVTRGPDGIKRYDGPPTSLVHMLRTSDERHREVRRVASRSCGTWRRFHLEAR